MRLYSIRFVLVFITLWLPTHTFAMVTMLYCDHHLHNHGQYHGESHDRHHADHDLSRTSSPCEQCSWCQNCSYSALPSALIVPPPDFVFPFQDAKASPFQPFFPEQLQRPPRRLLRLTAEETRRPVF